MFTVMLSTSLSLLHRHFPSAVRESTTFVFPKLYIQVEESGRGLFKAASPLHQLSSQVKYVAYETAAHSLLVTGTCLHA